MNCQETREKLSIYADSELRGGEAQAVVKHLSDCSACRQEFGKQGDLDMLLKKNYESLPSDRYFDSFWPSVEQRLHEDPEDDAMLGYGGGSAAGNEFHFKSSPALQALEIPEKKRPTTVAEVSVLEKPKAKGGGYMWPVAFIVAAFIVTGGFVFLQMSKREEAHGRGVVEKARPQQLLASAELRKREIAKESMGGEKEGKGVGTEVESEPGEPGMETVAATSGEPASPKLARESRTRAKVSSDKKDSTTSAEGKEQPASEKESEPGVAAVKSKSGKGDALDNLIDNALGTEKTAEKEKLEGKSAEEKPAAKAAPEVGVGLPENLDMNQVRTGMRKLNGLVQSCYDKYQVAGTATVKLTINNDGTVSDVKIKGKFFGTDTGTCVQNAVQNGRFPKFSGSPMSITYPITLSE
ncbi:MAG: AgmX/PglI C-terminal domain-containing protein [Pseudomonadota bacterium]